MDKSMEESHGDYTLAARQPAILLVGPTGSGKSPLGDYFEKTGFNGRRCCHFDFGRSLRELAAGESVPDGLTSQDLSFVTELLEGGALLEKNRFYIAAGTLRHFIYQKQMGIGHFLVLNGLPRHVEQAKEVDRMIEVKHLLYLSCTADVVRRRIEINSGGDRSGRNDDSPEEIERKLELFRERTIPLLEYYTSRGVAVHTIEVNLHATPKQILECFSEREYRGS